MKDHDKILGDGLHSPKYGPLRNECVGKNPSNLLQFISLGFTKK